MTLLTEIQSTSKKITREVVALFLTKCSFFSLLFFIPSCNVNSISEEENRIKDEFRMSLDTSMDALNSLEIQQVSRRNGSEDIIYSGKSMNDIIYLEIPDDINQTSYYNGNSITRMSDIANVINAYDASITYSKSASGISLNIPTEKIIEKLDPSMQAAKNYLYSKGFS